MIELPRSQISELHFAKFPDTVGFQCWNTNLKTEVCSCSGYPTLAVLWIKEAEVAKSVDDFMRSQSVGGAGSARARRSQPRHCLAYEGQTVSAQALPGLRGPNGLSPGRMSPGVSLTTLP